MKKNLIIFAKEPEEGKVKTRLSGEFTEKQCVELYKSFLKDTMGIVRNINSDGKMMAYDSEGEPVYIRCLAQDLVLYKQRGRDLGEKMHNAFTFSAEKGFSKTVIIGSDSPDLPAEYVEKAFLRLDENDIVLGPSYDGGYYLIGLKEPCPDLFKDVKWSSISVMEQTLNNAESTGKKVFLLDKWYDIDTRESLEHLKGDPKGSGCVFTRETLNKIYKKENI